MKKGFIKLLSLVLAAAFIPVAYAEDEAIIDITNEEAYAAVDGLGLLPDSVTEKAEMNGYLTRAEYAEILYNIVTFDTEIKEQESWEKEFFGDFSFDETAEVAGEATVFTDVDTAMDAGDAILYICARGIMEGKGSGIFDPDAEISYIEAAKPIVSMLGYSQYANISGGYWKGIQTVLDSLDLYEPSAKDKMTVLDVCKLIWSAFDEQVMIFKFSDGSVTYEESEQTFMNKWMQLDKCRGIVYDNGITALSGKSVVGKGKIKVGDMVLDAEKDFSDMIGREVWAYYSYSDDKENEVFFLKETSKNIVTVIAAEDIEKYDNYTIEYIKGNSSRKIKLESDAYVIYNGKSVTSWSSDTFDITDGNVTVIDNGSDDVVLIEDYINVVVSYYNSSEGKIYNRAKDGIDGNGDEVIDIKTVNEDGNLYVYWATGEETTADSIKAGLVADIIQNGDYVKIILSNNIVTDAEINSIDIMSDDDRYFEVTSGEEAYKVFKRYKKAQGAVNITVNSVYALYLNRNGVVVWAESNYAKDGTAAYLIKTYIDEETELLNMQILSENGKVFYVISADSVKYTDTEGNKFKLNASSLYVRLRDYNGILIYKTNELGDVTAIEMPRETSTEDTALQNIDYNTAATMSYKTDGTYGTFRGEVFVNESTKIFSVPTTVSAKADLSNYKVGTKSTLLRDNTTYSDFKAYTLNQNSRLASYLVMPNSASNEFLYSSASLQFMLVDKISNGLSSDDEECVNVSGWLMGYNVKTNDYITKYACYDETDSKGNKVCALDIAQDLLSSYDAEGNTNTYKVQKGDIIRYCTDESGEKITAVQILYGIERENPAFPSGKNGWLVGTTGYYDENNAYSNPFSVTNNGSNTGKVNKLTEANKHWGGGTRFYAGFVYDCVDGIVELTANDLSVNAYNSESYAYFPEYRIMKTSTVITSSNKKLSVSSGGEDALKTYKNAGAECSRMITVDLDNTFRFYLIINVE